MAKKPNSEPSVGRKVKLYRHWLRGSQIGHILDRDPDRANSWLVQFETSRPGGGLGGNKLWLSDKDFQLV